MCTLDFPFSEGSPFYFHDNLLIIFTLELILSLAKKSKKLDVLQHALVPFHTILTKKETADLLKKYAIRLVDLPRIFEDEPATLALGAKEGDVLKIVRNSATIVDTVETFRFVVIRR